VTTGWLDDKRRWLWLLLALALVHGLIYAAVTPPWQAPDETGHFEYAWLIAHLGRLPSIADLSPAFEAAQVASLYEWRYGDYIGRPLPPVMPARLADLPGNIFAANSRTVTTGRFSLSYLWQALFLLPVRAQGLVVQLLMARLSSVALSLGIVWLAFNAFCEMEPARPKAALAMALVMILIPQHTFINSSVGDGTLAELMASVVFYCWVLLFRRGARVPLIIGIALGTLFAALSKATAYFLAPLDLVLALWWFFRQRRQPWSHKRFAYLAIGAVALGIGAWVASHSGLGEYVVRSIQAVLTAPKLLLTTDARGMTLEQALLATVDSFWANFGWMAVPASQRWYGAILFLTAMAGVGWLVGGKHEHEAPAWAGIMMGAAFLCAFVVYVWGALLSSGSDLYQYQGRYLFPAALPFAFLLVGGWLRLLPARHQNTLFAAVVFLAMFDACALMGYLIPYFYYH
jgi:hypothetical protein